MLPVGLIDAATHNKRVTFKPKMKTSFAETKEIAKISLDKENQVFIVFPVPLYLFVSYVPSVVMTWILYLFNASPLWLLYMGRLCNLLTFAAAGYFAIKITPVKKTLFFAACLIPMALYEASTMSTDSLINSAAVLLCAYILYLAYDKNLTKIGKKEIVITSILSVILVLGKLVYLPILFLFWLIPEEKFCHKKIKVFGALFILNIAAAAFLTGFNCIITQGITSFSSNLDKGELLKFIFVHPLNYIQKLFLTLFLNFKEYMHGLVGIFGWSDTHLPNFAILQYFIVLGICATVNFKKDGINLTMSQRYLVLFSVFFSVFLILSIFYLLFMPDTKTNTILGVQGRYFIPLLVPFLLIFSNNKFHLRTEHKIRLFKNFILFSINFVLFISLIRIIYRFYI